MAEGSPAMLYHSNNGFCVFATPLYLSVNFGDFISGGLSLT